MVKASGSSISGLSSSCMTLITDRHQTRSSSPGQSRCYNRRFIGLSQPEMYLQKMKQPRLEAKLKRGGPVFF
ncbi:hypothetical protein GUJ93_ZPchr0006g40984 [Zizania palustris]|uniref:Uncharacterized protein n=1 Tax=Zizania palustris TaxID=103762 RepID=A0A8J5TFL3_ZIZPA|nr:hypothetical protein GUJ93_ZPchr0006g40984 [Zizania palustris]